MSLLSEAENKTKQICFVNCKINWFWELADVFLESVFALLGICCVPNSPLLLCPIKKKSTYVCTYVCSRSFGTYYFVIIAYLTEHSVAKLCGSCHCLKCPVRHLVIVNISHFISYHIREKWSSMLICLSWVFHAESSPHVFA